MPAANGVFLAGIEAVGANGSTRTDVLIAVGPTLSFLTTALPDANLGTMYSQYIIVGGGVPATMTVVSGSLPPGLQLKAHVLEPRSDSLAFFLTGTAATPGTYSFTVQASRADGVTARRDFQVRVLPFAVATESLTRGRAGQPYRHQLTSTGSALPHTWTLAGALPSGLSMTPSGVISGTPTAAGNSTTTVHVGNTAGGTASRTLTLAVDAAAPPLRFTASSLAPAKRGFEYSEAVPFTGGVPPYLYSIASGSLPSGLSVDSVRGLIGGVPLQEGTFRFTVRVVDGIIQVAQQQLTLVVEAAAPAPSFAAESVVNGASFAPGIAPGSLFTIAGENLAADLAVPARSPLPETLGDVVVRVNGSPVPLLAVHPRQINAQLPFNVGGAAIQVVVEREGVASPAAIVGLKPVAPGLFQVAAGELLAINEDGSVNGAAHPSPAGSVVVVYATGAGELEAELPVGGVAPLDRLVYLRKPVSATVGGLRADVQFAGAAPGLSTGLIQLNIAVPAELPDGRWPMVLTIDGQTSNAPSLAIKGR